MVEWHKPVIIYSERKGYSLVFPWHSATFAGLLSTESDVTLDGEIEIKQGPIMRRHGKYVHQRLVCVGLMATWELCQLCVTKEGL